MSDSEDVSVTPRRRGFRMRGWMAALVPVLLAAWLVWAIVEPRHDAGVFLQQVRTLKVGQTPYRQVVELLSHDSGEATCYDDDCAVQFENGWLRRLHLAPATELHIVLRRNQGTLAGISLAMMVEGKSLQQAPRASAMVYMHPAAGPEPAWQAVITRDPAGRAVKTYVELTPQATAAQQAQSLKFNLKCLTRWGGCGSSRELLPGVWAQARKVDWVQ